MSLRLRLRGPSGGQSQCTMEKTATLHELCTAAAQAFELKGEAEVLLGYPPALCVSHPTTTLGELLRSGETIIVREIPTAVVAAAPTAKAEPVLAAVVNAAPQTKAEPVREVEWTCVTCKRSMDHTEEVLACKHCGGPAPLNILAPSVIMAITDNDDAKAAAELLKLGEVELNVADAKGYTVLHLACQSGLVRTVEAILDRSDFRSVNAADPNGRTALLWAAKKGINSPVQATAMIVRIMACPDLNEVFTRDENGMTALHHAANAGDAAPCEILMKRCPLGVKNDKGQTAYDMASLRSNQHPKYEDVAKLLR